jgi:hypothetical protein
MIGRRDVRRSISSHGGVETVEALENRPSWRQDGSDRLAIQQSREHVMKLLFVSVEAGERRVHWAKFVAFSVLVLIIAAAVAEALAYLLKGGFSFGGLVTAETLAALILARILIRTLAYQPAEVKDAERS